VVKFHIKGKSPKGCESRVKLCMLKGVECVSYCAEQCLQGRQWTFPERGERKRDSQCLYKFTEHNSFRIALTPHGWFTVFEECDRVCQNVGVTQDTLAVTRMQDHRNYN
jgi:hypothetical protein